METNEERKWCVYIHTSPSNKAYIGITCQKPEDRWRNGAGYTYDGKQPVFSAAINKYGWDNFEHIIWADRLSEQEAKHMEMLLIALFKTNCCKYYNPSYGYNCTDGGDGTVGYYPSIETREKLSKVRKGHFISEETKKKISDSECGKIITEETKKKISASLKGKYVGEKNWNYGKVMSEQEREKLRLSHIGKTASEETRKKQSESMKGKMAGEHHPMYGKHLSAETKAKISKSNKGRKVSEETKQKLSEIGKRKVLTEDEKELLRQRGLKNSRSVICIETNTVYSSMMEAERQTGIPNGNIRRACNNHGMSGNYHWVYYDEYLIQQKN